MELRLTLVDRQRLDDQVDVLIDAPPGTRFAAVRDQLTATLGVDAAEQRTFHCGREPIDGSHPLGLPPLLQAAVLTLTGDRPQGRSDPPLGLLEAHVIAGPDAGSVVPLTLGRHTIGRDTGHLIQLTDTEVSRTHAELTVRAARIEIQDVGSTNGTWLGDRRLGTDPAPVCPDDQVRIGTGVICVRGPDRPPARIILTGDGHVAVNRGPHLHPGRAQREISFPAEPPDRPAARLPWPAMLLPLLIAIPLALLWKQPTFLLFAVMTPVLMGGQYFADRRTGRRESAARRAEHQAAIGRREQELTLATAADAAHLEATRPDLARLTVTARIPTDELWLRTIDDPQFLVLRLGRGPEPAQITVRRPGAADDVGERGTTEPIVHADVPVAIDLPAARVLGICGPRRAVLALARSLVGQIAVLHSPREVRIQILTADPGLRRDWRWAAWLPHLDACEPGVAISHPDDGSHRILLLDGAHLLHRRPELAAALKRPSTTGNGGDSRRAPLVLCLDRAEPDLPTGCAATVTLDAGPDRPRPPERAIAGRPEAPRGRAVLRRSGRPQSWFVPDLAGERWAEQLARDLAPLRDAAPEPGHGLPTTVRLIDLLIEVDQVRATESADLARHWRRRSAAEPSATLGVTASGPFRIDLRRDGPHLLVGGTTGAGKSELLQSLVAALAVGGGPDVMSFLLVDYKGGAAFRECAHLPQVGGVITDLDPALARRALVSLTAELRRRERLYARPWLPTSMTTGQLALLARICRRCLGWW